MKAFLLKLRRRFCRHDWQCIGTRDRYIPNKHNDTANPLVKNNTQTSWLCFRCGARRDENLNWSV